MVSAKRTSPRQEIQWGQPRVDVVFRLWQCDKENHGWREGPPVTVLRPSFDLLAGPSPSGKVGTNENKNTALRCWPPAPHRTLAGIKGLRANYAVRGGSQAHCPESASSDRSSG